MKKDEFKKVLSDLIDEVVPGDGDTDISDEGEDNLVDQLGEVAAEIFASDTTGEEDAEAEPAS